MIDIKTIRENPEIVVASLKKRGMDNSILDEIRTEDEAWRASLKRVEELRAERNKANVAISQAKKAGKDASSDIESMRGISKEISDLENENEAHRQRIDELMLDMPNLLHETVPKGLSDDDNEVVKTWGEKRDFSFQPKNHIDVMEPLDLVDLERAAKVSGARFYYLKNEAVLMQYAIVRFVLNYLREKGFSVVVPPVLINGKTMTGAGFLPAGKDDIYKIEEEDLYLVGTSEQALAGLHMDEIIESDKLPLYYAGYSSCFRTEAGSHGKDTKGIFRVHQFDKIEMFKFTKPEESWKEHDSLLEAAEGVFRALEIPYRVVNVCSSEMGNVAAKKYDIEAWFPGIGAYREVVSCSNCTDYQARRLNCRHRANPGDKPEFVHTLNSTACAISRALVAIFENYQNEDGSVTVPKILRDDMGMEKIILKK